jgi:hypothetical protein
VVVKSDTETAPEAVASKIYVNRAALSQALAEMGLIVAVPTLTTWATRGGGPPFRKFGKKIVYDLAAAVAWAESRMTPAVTSSAELRRVTGPDPK